MVTRTNKLLKCTPVSAKLLFVDCELCPLCLLLQTALDDTSRDFVQQMYKHHKILTDRSSYSVDWLTSYMHISTANGFPCPAFDILKKNVFFLFDAFGTVNLETLRRRRPYLSPLVSTSIRLESIHKKMNKDAAACRRSLLSQSARRKHRVMCK